MKKTTYLVLLIFSLAGFAQTNKQIINSYLQENKKN